MGAGGAIDPACDTVLGAWAPGEEAPVVLPHVPKSQDDDCIFSDFGSDLVVIDEQPAHVARDEFL